MLERLPDVRTDSSLAAARTLWQGDLSSAIGRVLKWVLTLGFVGVIAASAVGAWRFSDLFYEDGLLPATEVSEPPYADGSVVSIDDDVITIDVADTASPAIRRDGRFGIRWPGGRGEVGEILDSHTLTVVRRFVRVDGMPAPGDEVTVDSTTFYGDPASAMAIGFSEVDISTELGEFPAWYVAGESDTWVVITHGKGVDRTEALRALPTFVSAGYPALVISYRNDVDAQPDPSGMYRFGLTEWRDLQAGVQWALDQGAARVVLMGYSMGGAITMEFMHRSPFSERVAGVILDAPMLDLSRTIDRGAEDQGIPSILTSMSKALAATRFGLNWSEMNYLAKLDRIAVPILLFHGTDDARVPIELSEDLAAALPHSVTFVPVDGAGHVESWNVDQAVYESALRELLDAVDRTAGAGP